MYCYDGHDDVIIKKNYLRLTLSKNYFRSEKDTVCIPVSLECTDPAGDVWQDFFIRDAKNNVFISIDSEENYIGHPYRTMIFIAMNEADKNNHSGQQLRFHADCSICGQVVREIIETEVSALKGLTHEQNVNRAVDCYRSLEFDELWKRWIRNRYFDQVDMKSLIKERLVQMNGYYDEPYNFDDCGIVFLWEGNLYSAEAFGLSIKAEKSMKKSTDDESVISLVLDIRDTPDADYIEESADACFAVVRIDDQPKKVDVYADKAIFDKFVEVKVIHFYDTFRLKILI